MSLTEQEIRERAEAWVGLLRRPTSDPDLLGDAAKVILGLGEDQGRVLRATAELLLVEQRWDHAEIADACEALTRLACEVHEVQQIYWGPDGPPPPDQVF